jgi:amidophosphoribosyltransferase
VRYSTTGDTILRNVQPLFADLDTGGIALAHNGNLTNALTLRRDLISSGAICQSTSDSEVILHLMARSQRRRVVERFVEALRQIQGAYAFVCLTNDMLIGARDPIGIRPLVLGRLDGAYVLASETCALDIVGAEFVREIENGEIVTITADGIESHRPFPRRPARPCIFEYIYFARPDSRMGGDVLQAARGRMGEILAREAPAPTADLVISVPDSGNPAARGFARAAGLPQDDGIIKNRYVARTFIQPGQELRKHGLRLKFNPLPEIVGGRRLVVVDDSIVRGNTTRQIVQMLRDAGAAEVHMRISAPPIRHPCHYGIDMSTSEEMIAHGRTVEEIAAELGADSLAYLSLAGVYEAMGAERDRHCDACFTGDYPLAGSDDAGGKFSLELPLVQA